MGLVGTIIGGLLGRRGNAGKGFAQVATAGANAYTGVVGAKRVLAEPDAIRAANLRLKALDAATEFYKRDRKNWWESFVAGANAFLRPYTGYLIVNGFAAMWVIAYINPAAFSDWIDAGERIPDLMYNLLYALMPFLFGARELHHNRKHKAHKDAVERSEKLVADLPVGGGDSGGQSAGNYEDNDPNPALEKSNLEKFQEQRRMMNGE